MPSAHLRLKTVVYILLIALPGISLAQGGSSIMEKIVSLEEKLNRLEASQKKDLQDLRTKISQLGQNGGSGDPLTTAAWRDSLQIIRAELDRLEKEVDQAKSGADLTEEAELLKAAAAELHELVAKLQSDEKKNADPEPFKNVTAIAAEAKPPAAEPVTNKFKAKLYGFVKFEAIYDNTEVAQGDWYLYVKPGNSPQAEQDVFTMNARHTRFGLKFDGPALKNDGKVQGLIEVDFAGGFPNSATAARQPILRLRHAWVELNYPKWEARFGQDWALICSPFPNTTSFVVGAGKGNLWMRYPQIAFTLKQDPIKIAFSLNRPMAGNVKYEDYAGGDFDPVDDGERTGLPWLMSRCWVKLGPTTFSVSGHYGQEQINDLTAKPHDVDTYSINVDAVVNQGPFSFTVRGFYGENLNSFFGGVFQGYTRDSTDVRNIASMGGWAQMIYKFNDDWAATLGGGMDDPDDDDLTAGMRSKNDWVFGNVAYTIQKALTLMFECAYLKTSYLQGEAGDNLRFQFVTYYKF